MIVIAICPREWCATWHTLATCNARMYRARIQWQHALTFMRGSRCDNADLLLQHWVMVGAPNVPTRSTHQKRTTAPEAEAKRKIFSTVLNLSLSDRWSAWTNYGRASSVQWTNALLVCDAFVFSLVLFAVVGYIRTIAWHWDCAWSIGWLSHVFVDIICIHKWRWIIKPCLLVICRRTFCKLPNNLRFLKRFTEDVSHLVCSAHQSIFNEDQSILSD